MSGFKRFAVAGVGNFGAFIVKELLRLKKEGIASDVLILTPSASNPKSLELADLGASIAEVDYGSAESITKALTGIDVLICVFGSQGISVQEIVVEPAQRAGVKLFVPSEFGGDAEAAGMLPFKNEKFDVRKKLEEVGLPYTLFQTGLWPDLYFRPFTGFDLENGKVKLGGQGDAPISWTTRQDAARFIVHALVTFSKDKLEWKTFGMEGDRQSFNSILTQYEARKGVKLDITRCSREELETIVKENPRDLMAIASLAWELGGGALENIANDEWLEWIPKKAIDAIS